MPMKGTPRGTSVRKHWVDLVISSCDTDECVTMPWQKPTNYAQFQLSNVGYHGHAYVCEQTHGPRPTPEHQAAHSCGVRGCCNPRHIRWATPSENNADKAKHDTWQGGEANPAARLTENLVRQIRQSPESTLWWGQKLGVHPSTIGLARQGRTWGHVR